MILYSYITIIVYIILLKGQRYTFMNERYFRLYSPTFLAYPHVCILFKVVVRHNGVVELIMVHLLIAIILNKLDPNIFSFQFKLHNTMPEFDIHGSYNFRLPPRFWF